MWIIGGALIDTGTNVLSSVGLAPLPAARILDMHDVVPIFNRNSKQILGIGDSIQSVGTLEFYFHFVEIEFSVTFNTVPGSTPLIVSHKDLDDLGLNYQTLHKIIDRPKDGYKEKAEMRNYSFYLVFPEYGFL